MHIQFLADIDQDTAISIIGGGIGFFLAALINAVLLRAICKWVIKVDLDFKPAFLLSLLVEATNFVIQLMIFLGSVLLPSDLHLLRLPIAGGGLVISLVIAGGVYGVFVKDPDKYPVSTAHIGFGRGILVALMTYVLVGILSVGVVAALIFAGVVTSLHMH